MPYLVVEDFRAGQDSRKSKASAQAGTLRRLTNAHIDRGGAIEKRKAFVSTYALPSNTFGMANIGGSLYVFGSAAAPTLPSGVNYQRLQHPSASAMTGVLQVEIFNGLAYVIASFADASIHHFYDGTRVSDWYDGRARGYFDITAGSAYAGVQATTTITITGGTASPGVNKMSSITIGGVEVLGAAVDWITSHSQTATNIAAQINTYTSNPEWTAAAVGAVVTITKSLAGTAGNALAVVVTNAGDVTNTGAANTAGGLDPNAIDSIKVNGVEVMSTRVAWATTNTASAAAVATQINSYTSTPEYTATNIENRVYILAASAAGAGPNGFEVSVTTLGSITTANVTALAGGTAAAGTYTPGRSCRTIGTKMYVVSGSNLHFSKIADPTKYNSDQIGAGFINMATHASGSESLIGIKPFLAYSAVFAAETIQIWTLKADEEENEKVQVIDNAGTSAPRTIIGYKNGDDIFLGSDGIRSLRSAGDVSSTATVFEVGTAVDPQVNEHVASLSASVVERALSVVEPIDKRLWVSIGNRIFVFTYFSGAKISAWSEYLPGFTISDFAVIGTRIYARSGDTIYLYGGAANDTYDASEVTVEMPFVDGKTVSTWKKWMAFDADLEGTWDISIATDPGQEDTYEEIATVTGVTFGEMRCAFDSESSHIAPKLVHATAEYARISSLILQYEQEAAS